MAKTRRNKNAPVPIPEALLRGWIRGMILTLAGTGIVSWLILRQKIQENAIGYGAMGIILISVIAASAKAVNSAQKKRFAVSAISGLIYWISLAAANLLIGKGEYHGLWTTLFLALGGGIVANFMNFTGKKKNTSLVRKISNG